jgi:hypothetical protein
LQIVFCTNPTFLESGSQPGGFHLCLIDTGAASARGIGRNPHQ